MNLCRLGNAYACGALPETLPSGQVTFVFTDIEGSDQPWP